MKNTPPVRIKTISEFHELRGFPKAEHPLISVVRLESMTQFSEDQVNVIMDFYLVMLKRTKGYKYKYGQHPSYDFNEGILFFMAPNQVLSIEIDKSSAKMEGWALLVHPDFLWHTSLAKTIKQYDFFDYSTNEALFLSDKEETTINIIVENIRNEYRSNIDKFSKGIIISHLETLFSYSERFYNRQFLTREKSNHEILDRLEELLTTHFNSPELTAKGLPTVQDIAQQLNISPKYLGSLLRVLTGQNAQQHIQNKVLEKAREKLSTTNLSVREIAYQLGFEHAQSFSRLFKTKMNQSPLEFRASFN